MIRYHFVLLLSIVLFIVSRSSPAIGTSFGTSDASGVVDDVSAERSDEASMVMSGRDENRIWNFIGQLLEVLANPLKLMQQLRFEKALKGVTSINKAYKILKLKQLKFDSIYLKPTQESGGEKPKRALPNEQALLYFGSPRFRAFFNWAKRNAKSPAAAHLLVAEHLEYKLGRRRTLEWLYLAQLMGSGRTYKIAEALQSALNDKWRFKYESGDALRRTLWGPSSAEDKGLRPHLENDVVQLYLAINKRKAIKTMRKRPWII
uniref:Uncharacterized protein n=1 Tax=Peronospora matthiolae TaxID=2874970 RepID=A0AAV1TYI1_9STRA